MEDGARLVYRKKNYAIAADDGDRRIDKVRTDGRPGDLFFLLFLILMNLIIKSIFFRVIREK